MKNTPHHWSRWIFGRLVFVEISRTLWFITDYAGFKNTLLVAFTVTENPRGQKIHRLIVGGLCVGWASV
jgi:hypothetical protein